ncbi:hypothetical protein A2704_02565 [Candidatus Kaiserbacteria bacterium RIFCSPHIGHO2_01_FULL_54_36b]|uniref:Uncharacterized protein n=1 Tax=Candidatus Kaiserbacteria bacterium RIFCSPHIGHO2_01_FULL_54_36b TaxID=1798483 RepID=A0A1F6CLT5_9BACT|nr:MAG: hypothetical protein A2704_02565 [Candidatus Kaiserbacteria bacterium RIFCSPHIGHO2_01_FULL_54_36b]
MTQEGYSKKDVLKKYARNNLAGRRAMRDSRVNLLRGYPKSWHENSFAAILFTPESEVRLKGVTQRIEAVGKDLGIVLQLAGKDFPFHSTLLTGAPPEDLSTRDGIYSRLYADAAANACAKELEGMNIEYRYLLVSEDSITLNADSIPSQIKSFRDALSTAMRAEGTKPISMDNILHVTLARITHLPDGGEHQALQALAQALVGLRHELSKGTPVTVTVNEVTYGQVIPPQR